MKKILHIISSPKSSDSFSIKLGNSIVKKIKATYPDSTVKERNLAAEQFPHLTQDHLTAFFTPDGQRSPESIEAVRYSDEAIAELMDADIIVLGAPLYNFTIHSSLKAWIDHITRNGHTFSYDKNGVEGLVRNKKVYVAFSSGFVYSDGPMKEKDFVTPYLRTILGFLGMTDVEFFRVEGTIAAELREEALAKGIESVVID